MVIQRIKRKAKKNNWAGVINTRSVITIKGGWLKGADREPKMVPLSELLKDFWFEFFLMEVVKKHE